MSPLNQLLETVNKLCEAKPREWWLDINDHPYEIYNSLSEEFQKGCIHIIEADASRELLPLLAKVCAEQERALAECLTIKEDTPVATCRRYWKTVKEAQAKIAELIEEAGIGGGEK